jgi:hypothetical protein
LNCVHKVLIITTPVTGTVLFYNRRTTYMNPPWPAGSCIKHLISYFWLRTRCSERILFISRGVPPMLLSHTSTSSAQTRIRKRFIYLITDKILFFAMCRWCDKTHPIASFLITCIQIVTSFFSFTKNLNKKSAWYIQKLQNQWHIQISTTLVNYSIPM